jgi:NADPH:quinone reductase-like Zn-dependent oxidoreductase
MMSSSLLATDLYVAAAGSICWCQLHRHLLQVTSLDRCHVCPLNLALRKGLYPIESFPAVLGQEASGTVVGLPTDSAILNDPEYRKRGFEIDGKVAIKVMGTFAEYIAVPWVAAFPVPSTLSHLTAAAGLLQGITAVSFMEEAYNVQEDDIILIHTIAGGLGQLMCQLAKSRKATVIGTTSTKAKAALATELGADHVILYTEEDIVGRVLDITNGEGVHAVFDGVGKDTYVL